jgi:hypothetical protein
MNEQAQRTKQSSKEKWRPWWVRVWRWVCMWWFRDVKLPAYQVASPHAATTPLTVGALPLPAHPTAPSPARRML